MRMHLMNWPSWLQILLAPMPFPFRLAGLMISRHASGVPTQDSLWDLKACVARMLCQPSEALAAAVRC